MSSVLERLEPPIGWHLHEGAATAASRLEGARRRCPLRRLAGLATDLGDDTPPGLWVVRMSRHGARVSLAEGVQGPQADLVRALMQEHSEAPASVWASVRESLRSSLDPQGVLNPQTT